MEKAWNENMKGYLVRTAVVLAIMAAVSFVFFTVDPQPVYADNEDIASGDNWRITSEYELIIGKDETGTNLALDDSFPWSGYKNEIKKISFRGTVYAMFNFDDVGNLLFSNCRNLTSVDLTGLDTSNVKDMSMMFIGCSSLTSVDLTSLDTSNVTNMGGMFSGCSSLTSVDLTGLDTSNVTYMYDMFIGCSSLTSVDLTGLDTSNVASMQYMFSNCSSLTSIDLTGLDTSNVTDMYEMFSHCSSLISTDLTGLDTSSVTYMTDMFSGCNALTDIALGSKTMIPNDGTLDTNWTRYKMIDGTEVEGPTIKGLSNYTGAYPGWYTTRKCPNGHKWNADYSIDKEATCTTGGSKSIHCSVCDVIKEGSEITIKATGHSWSAPAYTWSSDYKTVTASRTCTKNGSHKETETTSTTSTVTKKATYSSKGTTTYTAVFKNPAFAAQTKAVDNLPKLSKKANPMTVKAVEITVKAKSLNRKAQTVKPIKVRNTKGTVTYKVVGGNAKAKRALRLDQKTGKITVKKKTKKGIYTIKVKVTAAGTSVYKNASKTVKVTVKVK